MFFLVLFVVLFSTANGNALFSAAPQCRSPFKAIGTGFSSKCAYLNQTTGGTITYKDAQLSCLKSGGRIMNIDDNQDRKWMEKQEKSKACWVGEKDSAGCHLMFADNSLEVDKACTGSRGFGRTNVK